MGSDPIARVVSASHPVFLPPLRAASAAALPSINGAVRFRTTPLPHDNGSFVSYFGGSALRMRRFFGAGWSSIGAIGVYSRTGAACA